ncbi:MAG: glycosyltransferase [Ferruginibacter sp.]
MHLLFISTHNFATNPRLVKEIKLALEAGFEVSVLCCEYSNWSRANNEKIKADLLPHIHYYKVPGDRKPLIPWLMSSIYFKAAGILTRIFTTSTRLLSVASNKRSWLLMQALPKVKGKPDLVIAHNPGSFYPAQLFAKRNNIPFGIDLEDHHPGETNDPHESGIMRRINMNVLPQAAYVSTASPLIAQYAKADLQRPLQNEISVLNYFSGKEFAAPANRAADEPLKLVWFSQNISHGRGLEELIPVVEQLNGLQLFLYGTTDAAFYEKWLKDKKNIVLLPAMPQQALHLELGKYDVGLALEKPASNLNRDLCLTNKILAYYQAGLYILASETQAQVQFVQKYPAHATLCSLDEKSLKNALMQLQHELDSIRSAAAERYRLATTDSWEKEGAQLVHYWKKLTAQ